MVSAVCSVMFEPEAVVIGVAISGVVQEDPISGLSEPGVASLVRKASVEGVTGNVVP